jgi:hypothetical protein
MGSTDMSKGSGFFCLVFIVSVLVFWAVVTINTDTQCLWC